MKLPTFLRKKKKDKIVIKYRSDSNVMIDIEEAKAIIEPLFDYYYYNVMNPDVESSDMDAIEHYLLFGSREERNPNPLFDNKYYRISYMKNSSSEIPLLHYMENFQNKNINPHPLFNTEYYLDQLGTDFDFQNSPLEHFLNHGWKLKLSPTELFDVVHYLNTYDDIAQADINALVHYVMHGESEYRTPTPEFFPELYQFQKKEKQDTYLALHATGDLMAIEFDNISPFNQQLEQLDENKPTFLFVTHEATLTGAPLIILKIIEQFNEFFNVNIITLIGKGGDLEEAFAKHGPTYLFNSWSPSGSLLTNYEIESLLEVLKNYEIDGIYINSAESRALTEPLRLLNAPIISLVHEMAYLYPDNEFSSIADHSDLIIFPSNIVSKYASENTYIPKDKSIVRGQGLLKPEILSSSVDKARKSIRKELGLPKDAFIILGCGTLTMRKGPDLFIYTAFEVLKKKKDQIYFVWIGNRHPDVNDSFEWIYHDIELKGLEDRILFPGAKSDPNPYFLGSDLFFLTSRADPFPCVVHEAMASSLPIVAFEGAGGYTEILSNKCGVLVDYGNLPEASTAILELIENQDLRKAVGTNAKTRIINDYMYEDYTFDIANFLITLKAESHNKSDRFEKFINAVKQRI